MTPPLVSQRKTNLISAVGVAAVRSIETNRVNLRIRRPAFAGAVAPPSATSTTRWLKSSPAISAISPALTVTVTTVQMLESVIANKSGSNSIFSASSSGTSPSRVMSTAATETATPALSVAPRATECP